MLEMPLTPRQRVVLLLYQDEAGNVEGVDGITRLQKYLFLVQQGDEGPRAVDADANFEPYKFGPCSRKLYDDLELLENLELITSEPIAPASEVEEQESELTFEFLMGDDDEAAAEAQLEEKRFQLTEKGRELAESIVRDQAAADEVNAIRRVKSKFASYSLRDLLRYVYRKYPAWTTQSEIRDQIL